tara:strand:- start:48 stop:602 length:555 start_codon:yes stop_codon:yes gene_type:complete
MITLKKTVGAKALVAASSAVHFQSMVIFSVTAIIAVVIFGFATNAFAAGSSSGSNNSGKYKSYGISKEMRKATALVNQEAFADALLLLKKEVAGDPDNADAWNLIGFSSRNLGDYVTSEEAYDKALAINPNHKGALEYKGELYLTLGNLAGAEELLARLRKSCSFNCSEVKDLNDAVVAYKKVN